MTRWFMAVPAVWLLLWAACAQPGLGPAQEHACDPVGDCEDFCDGRVCGLTPCGDVCGVCPGKLWCSASGACMNGPELAFEELAQTLDGAPLLAMDLPLRVAGSRAFSVRNEGAVAVPLSTCTARLGPTWGAAHDLEDSEALAPGQASLVQLSHGAINPLGPAFDPELDGGFVMVASGGCSKAVRVVVDAHDTCWEVEDAKWVPSPVVWDPPREDLMRLQPCNAMHGRLWRMAVEGPESVSITAFGETARPGQPVVFTPPQVVEGQAFLDLVWQAEPALEFVDGLANVEATIILTSDQGAPSVTTVTRGFGIADCWAAMALEHDQPMTAGKPVLAKSQGSNVLYWEDQLTGFSWSATGPAGQPIAVSGGPLGPKWSASFWAWAVGDYEVRLDVESDADGPCAPAMEALSVEAGRGWHVEVAPEVPEALAVWVETADGPVCDGDSSPCAVDGTVLVVQRNPAMGQDPQVVRVPTPKQTPGFVIVGQSAVAQDVTVQPYFDGKPLEQVQVALEPNQPESLMTL